MDASRTAMAPLVLRVRRGCARVEVGAQMTASDVESTPSYGARLAALARQRPDEVAVLFVEESGAESPMTWAAFDRRSNQLARALAAEGVGQDDTVAVGLRNSLEHLVTCFAAWKLGAVPVPMRWDLPEWEHRRVLDVVDPTFVVEGAHAAVLADAEAMSELPLADAVSPNAWGVCSSGSTGTPKVILTKFPAIHQPGSFNPVVEAWGAIRVDQRVLVPAPLYHTNGFTCIRTLLCGHPIVLMERFNAALVLDLVERHRITGFIAATPFLLRLSRVEGIDDRDLSSLEWVQQGAAPLPVWLGRRICELIGPEHFFLSYGASEQHGLVIARGDEYLEHPGTLGRPMLDNDLKILGEDGEELPAGEVGAIYMRTPVGPLATYKGAGVAPLTMTPDGFATVGDLGWVDADGFVFLADRRVDMIVTGGANVYPAEVESALSEHTGIADVVVIGLPDEEWGHRVHALIQPVTADALGEAEIIAFAKERLAPYKAPKTVEFLEHIPRTEAMKVNRGALVTERSEAT